MVLMWLALHVTWVSVTSRRRQKHRAQSVQHPLHKVQQAVETTFYIMTKLNTIFTVLGVVVLGSITTYATGKADMLSQTSGGELAEDHHRHRRQAGPMPFPPGFPFPPHMGDMGRPNTFRGSFGRRPFNSPFPGRMSRQGFPTGGNRQQGSRFYPRQPGGFRNMRRPTPNAAAPGPAPTMMPTPRRTTQRMQTPNMVRNSGRIGQTMQQTKTPTVSNMGSAEQINTASMDNLRPQEGNARVSKETTRLQNTTFMSNGDQVLRRDQTSPRDQTARRDQTSRDQGPQRDQASAGDQTFRRDQTNSPRDQATFRNQAARNQVSQRDQQTTVRQQSFPNDQASRLDQGSSRNQASLRNQASQRDQTTLREQGFPNDQASRLDQGSSRNQASRRNQATQRDQTTLREQSFPNDQVSRRTQASLRNQAPRNQVSQREQQTTLRQQAASNDRGSRRNQASPRDQNSLREQTSPLNEVPRRDQSPLRNQASLRDQVAVRNPTLQDAGNTNFSPTPEPDILAAETSNMLGGAKVLEISFVPSGRQAMSMQPSWVVSRQDGTVPRSDRQGVNNVDTLDQLYMNEPQSVGFGKTGPIGNAAELPSNLQNPMSERMADSRSAAQGFQQQGQTILGMMDASGSSMIGGQGDMRNKLDRFAPSMDTLDGTVNGNIGGSTAQDFQQVGQNMMTMMDATPSATNDGRGQMRNKLGRFESITSIDGPLTRNVGGSNAQDFQQQGNDLMGMMDGQRMNNFDGFSNSFDAMDRRVTGNMGGSTGQDFQQLGQNILGMMDATGSSMIGGRGQMRNNNDGFATSINTIDRNQAGNIGDSMSKNFQQKGNDLMSVMDAADSSLISGQGQMTNSLDGFSNFFNTADGGMTGNIGGSAAQDFQQLGQNMIGMADSTGSFVIGGQGQTVNNMDGFANSLNIIGGRGQMRNSIDGFATSINTIDRNQAGNMGDSMSKNFQQKGNDLMSVMGAADSSLISGQGQMTNSLDGFSNSFNTADGGIGGSAAQDFQHLGQNVIGMVDSTGSFVIGGHGQTVNNMDGFANSLNNIDGSMSMGRDFSRSTAQDSNPSSQNIFGMMDPSGSSISGGRGNRPDGFATSFDVRRSRMSNLNQADLDMLGMTIEHVPLVSAPAEIGSNNDMSNSMFDGTSQTPMDIDRSTSRIGRRLSSTNSNVFSPSGSPVMEQSFMDNRGFTDPAGSMMVDGGYLGLQDSVGLSGPNRNMMDFTRDSPSNMPMSRWADSPSSLNRNTNNAESSPSQFDTNRSEPSMMDMDAESFMNARGYTDINGPVMMDGGLRDAGTMTQLNGQDGSNNEYPSTPLDSNANRNGNSVRIRNYRIVADGTGPSPSQMDPNQPELSVMNGLSFSNSRFTNTDAAGSFMVDGGNRGAPDFIGSSV